MKVKDEAKEALNQKKSVEELEKSRRELKRHKASACDGIIAEFFFTFRSNIVGRLHLCFSYSRKRGRDDLMRIKVV